MKTATLAKKRIDAIQQLIQAGNNDIDSWAELARRLREDKAERTNLLAYFNRCKRPEKPQLMSLEMATEVAKAFIVEPNTIYIELGEGEVLPTTPTTRSKTPSRTDITAIAKKTPPVLTSLPITIKCPELGIDQVLNITVHPRGANGPLFGAINGDVRFNKGEDPAHRTMDIIGIPLNSISPGVLLQLVEEQHEQSVATK